MISGSHHHFVLLTLLRVFAVLAPAALPWPIGDTLGKRSTMAESALKASAAEHARDLSIPLASRRALVALLDWQLWYWGQDIQHAQGNALLAYGFDRVRGPQDGTQRSTAYTLQSTGNVPPALHDLSSLTVWGFGICATHAGHGSDGSLILVRHESSLGLSTCPLHAKAGTRNDLPARVFPQTSQQWRAVRQSLVSVARCVIDYETWAKHTLGAAHRANAQARRPRAVRRRHSQPPFLAKAWREFADDQARDAMPEIR